MLACVNVFDQTELSTTSAVGTVFIVSFCAVQVLVLCISVVAAVAVGV